jgi:hypothetical protein
MKRDMELVRKILLVMEAEPSGTGPMYPKIEGYDPETVMHHIYIMGTGKLIECDPGVSANEGHVRKASARNIMWDGYEFLNAARDQDTWEQAKETVRGAGRDLSTVTIGVLQGILTAIIARSMGLQ